MKMKKKYEIPSVILGIIRHRIRLVVGRGDYN